MTVILIPSLCSAKSLSCQFEELNHTSNKNSILQCLQVYIGIEKGRNYIVDG